MTDCNRKVVVFDEHRVTVTHGHAAASVFLSDFGFKTEGMRPFDPRLHLDISNRFWMGNVVLSSELLEGLLSPECAQMRKKGSHFLKFIEGGRRSCKKHIDSPQHMIDPMNFPAWLRAVPKKFEF